MTGSTPRRGRLDSIWTDVRVPAAEIVVQVALVVVAAALVESLQGREMPERALATLIFAGGVAATILMGVASWMSGNRRARRVAAAVGLYTGVALLLRAVDAEGGPWALGGGIAGIGVAGLLLLAVRGSADPRRDRGVAAGVLVVVMVGAFAVVVMAILAPAQVPPRALVAVVDAVAWSGTALAGLLLVVVGTVVDRPLARRAGLAFATLGTAHVVGILGTPQVTGVLELGAVTMFLLTAVPFLVAGVRAVGHQQELARTRLAEFEAVIASVEERDHELRNVVAGLSGAARVLTDRTLGSSVDGQRLLVAAGAELARLQQMLDGPRAANRASEVTVGPLLRDLAVMHGATGLDVEVGDVDDDLSAAIDPDALTQILTNLLVNCARHASGARVSLRAREQGGLVRIEVVDDGPGLPPGESVAVLRRGVRGPDSTGDGLGLAITGDLVESHGGTFTLHSRGRGCTAVVQLPTAVRTVQRIGA